MQTFYRFVVPLQPTSEAALCADRWWNSREHFSVSDRHNSADSTGRRRKNRRGPGLPTLWFSILGVHWFVLTALGLVYLRPHPLGPSDFAVATLGGLLGVFYLWVAYAVYRRRRYILDAAFACAGLGLFSFPVGTCFSVLLISCVIKRKHDFTK